MSVEKSKTVSWKALVGEGAPGSHGDRMPCLLEIMAHSIETIQKRITSPLEENKRNRDDLSGKVIFLAPEQRLR